MSPMRTFRSSTPPAVVLAVMRATRNATFDSGRVLATVNSFSSCSGVRARPMFFGSAILTLVYSGIDTFGLLGAPAAALDATGDTYKDWCEKYILPRIKSVEGKECRS